MRARNKESIGILRCCWLAAAGLLAGCSINDYGTCPPDGEDGRYSLRIQMMVPNAGIGTRASDHKEEPGSVAENFIDINDLRILIYDGEDGSLAMEIDQAKLEEGHVPSDTYTSYFIKVGPIDPDWIPNKLESFRIMVLANWNSFDSSAGDTRYPFSGTNIGAESPYSIYKNDRDFNFRMPQSSNESAWLPFMAESGGRYIPMFGISEILSIKNSSSAASSDGPTIDAGRISMLRSIAKVEIIDESGDAITSVALSKSNQYGRFIPDITGENSQWEDQWGDGTVQIVTPSLPANPLSLSDLKFVQGPDWENKKTFVAYIPEMDLSAGRPSFNMVSGQKQLSPAPFDNYDESGKVVTDENAHLQAVLRNHIYRYKVTVRDDASLALTLHVLPWDMEYDEHPWYFEEPRVKEYLTWTTTTGEVENPDEVDQGEEPRYKSNGYKDDPKTLTLTMKNSRIEYVEGTFTLTAPRNCKWYAQLVSLGGKPDAFFFVDGSQEVEVELKDADGNVVKDADGNPKTVKETQLIYGPDSGSGTIDGEQIHLRIAARYDSVKDYDNVARLVIMVVYPDNMEHEVKVVAPVVVNGPDNEPKIVDNYTIFQPISIW